MTKTMEDKVELVRLNRLYREAIGSEYFLYTEPAGGGDTRWVFTDGSVYSLDTALVLMRGALEALGLDSVR